MYNSLNYKTVKFIFLKITFTRWDLPFKKTL